MTKRVLLVTLALCLLLAGCGKTPEGADPFANDQPMPGLDAQNKYLMWPISFQETESFYFGSTSFGKHLHYYDKSNGLSGLLCADPTCAHNTNDCAAYVGIGTIVSYYDENLYWIAQEPGGRDDYLWRADLTGTNRTKVKRLDFDDFVLVYMPQRYAIHRGKLYILGRAPSVSGTQAGYRVTLQSTPLDDSEAFTTLYDQTFQYGVNPSFRFVGNHIYFSVVSFTADGIFHVAVTKFDIDTGESKVVYEEANITDSLGIFWVTQEGEIYLPGHDETRAYLWRVEDGKRVVAAVWEDEDPLSATVLDGVAVYVFIKDGARWFSVKNFSGEEIYNGELISESVAGATGNLASPQEYGLAFTGGDEKKLILNFDRFGGGECVTVLIDLTDNAKATVLWTSED